MRCACLFEELYSSYEKRIIDKSVLLSVLIHLVLVAFIAGV